MSKIDGVVDPTLQQTPDEVIRQKTLRQWKDLLKNNVDNALNTLYTHPELIRQQDLMLTVQRGIGKRVGKTAIMADRVPPGL
jgi:hypothetical protein